MKINKSAYGASKAKDIKEWSKLVNDRLLPLRERLRRAPTFMECVTELRQLSPLYSLVLSLPDDELMKSALLGIVNAFIARERLDAKDDTYLVVTLPVEVLNEYGIKPREVVQSGSGKGYGKI